MTPIDDEQDFEALADQELALAAAATDAAVKIHHLNAAARYATLSERSAAPHSQVEDTKGSEQ